MHPSAAVLQLQWQVVERSAQEEERASKQACFHDATTRRPCAGTGMCVGVRQNSHQSLISLPCYVH
jgi:hypothetical protein